MMGANTQTMGNEVENVKRRLQCDSCAADFSGPSGLYYHKQAIHKGISFECKECSSRFFKKYDLKIHVQAWHENVRHPCEQCDFKGLHRKDLALHIKIQHDQRRFNCGKCDQTFGRTWHLRRHMGSHMGTTYSCSDEECDQSFTLIDNLKRHRKVKHKESAKDKTPTGFIEQSVYFEGVNQIPGDAKTIDWVEEIFSPLSKSTKHSTSDGENCSGVNKSTFEQVQGGSARFENESNKVGNNIEKFTETGKEPNEHILKHTNKTRSGSTYWKWRCPECGKQTSNRSNLFRHRQNMHSGLVRFLCDQCEFKTKRNSHLKEHIQRMHQKREKVTNQQNKPLLM